MTDYIKLNEDTDLQLFHTLFTGQTNLAGKTTAIRSLIPRATKSGYTVLVFDTKPTVREFEGYYGYHEIPICYKPSTDPLILLGLAESIAQRRMSPFFATLARASETASNMGEIIGNLEQAEKSAKSGFIKDACYSLVNILRRLETELRGYSLSSTLDIEQRRINIMPLNSLSSEAQQLVIKTAFELALKHHNKKTLLVIDEAFRFLPQAYSSACKKPVQDVITQGAKTGLFVWLATQFIATTEKDAIKGMANKLLGRQDDPTEIKATIERTRESHPKLKPDDLMMLKRGEFIFVPVDGPVKKVYIPTDEKFKAVSQPPRERREAPPAVINPPSRKELKEAPTLQVPMTTERHTAPLVPLVQPKEPEPQKSELAAFTLQVTRLTSDSLEGKLTWLVKQHGAQRQNEILKRAVDYGWNISQSSASSALKALVADGLLTMNEHDRYVLPNKVQFDEIRGGGE